MECPLFEKSYNKVQSSKGFSDVSPTVNRRPFVSYKRFHPNYKTAPIVRGSEPGCIEHLKCTTLHYILPFQKAATTNKNLNNLESKLFQTTNQIQGERSNSVKRSRFSATSRNRDNTRHFSNIRHIYPNQNYGRSITVSTHRGRAIFKTKLKTRLRNRVQSKPNNNTQATGTIVTNKTQFITSTPLSSKVQVEETISPLSDEKDHIVRRNISPKLDVHNKTFLINSSGDPRSTEYNKPINQSLAAKNSTTNKVPRLPKTSSTAKLCDKVYKCNTNSNKVTTVPRILSPPKLRNQEKGKNTDEPPSAGTRVVNWLSYQYFRPITETEDKSGKSVQSCTNTSTARAMFVASKRAIAYKEAQRATSKNSYVFLTSTYNRVTKPYRRRRTHNRPKGHMSQYYRDKLKQSKSCHSDISGYTEVGDHFYIRRSQIDLGFDYNQVKSNTPFSCKYKNNHYQQVSGRSSCPYYFHNLPDVVGKGKDTAKSHRSFFKTVIDGMRSCKSIIF